MAEQTPTQRVTTVLFYGFLALLAWLTFVVFKPFLTPLIWAAVLVILFLPIHRRFERRLGKALSATLSTTLVTAILIVPAVLVVIAFVQQAIVTLNSIGPGASLAHSDWVNRIWLWLVAHLPLHGLVDLPGLAAEGARRMTAFLAAQAGGVLRNVLLFLFDLFITVFAMFYFFRDADIIMRWLRRSLPFAEAQREAIITQAHGLVFATVASTLAAAGITGLVGGLAFLIVGIHAVVFWGVVMAFFAFLPVLGAWMVWIPAAIWLISQGHPWRAVALLAICGAAVLLVDNVMRPMMISGRSELNGLLVLVGVLGGIAVFGLIGVVLGPVVIAISASLFQAYTSPPAVGDVSESARTAVIK